MHFIGDLQSGKYSTFIARALIGYVVFVNLQSAILFLWKPDIYAPGFEISGFVGDTFIRSLGILFLMWNVPYLVALINPRKYRISLYEAIIMQTIGLVGETLLLLSFPKTHTLLYGSVSRFILFDSIGLLALIISAWLTRSESSLP